MSVRKTILVAGGGTGGHVFPGLAVAHALQALADVDVVFAGSPRGLEKVHVPKHGYRLELLDVEPMKGGGPARALRGALVAAKAMRAATGMIGRIQPSAVLSVGGYAAGPAALACVRSRLPLAILEPNSVLGFTNRLLAPFASRAYVAWAETGRVFRTDKARLYGVPLRPGFEPQPYAAPPGRRRLLVLGGSQGASALNERLPLAVARAAKEVGDIDVVHQCGADRDGAVRAAYEAAGVTNAMVTPFVTDVADQMTAADVIVARGGAVTVAEISAIGRASIIVPFPHAADDHQAKNAAALAELGGSVCVRQEAADEVRLGRELVALLGDAELRTRMARITSEHGHPYAAEDIARDLLALAGIRERPRPPVAAPNNGGESGANGANGHSTMHVSLPKVVS